MCKITDGSSDSADCLERMKNTSIQKMALNLKGQHKKDLKSGKHQLYKIGNNLFNLFRK